MIKALRRWLASGLLAAGLCAAAAGAGAAPVALIDDRGVPLHLPGPAQRVISLLPSATESICALGGCDRLVGTDDFSNWPAQVRALPKLGGLEDAQLERILALQPQLVVAAPGARLLGRLHGLGIAVLALKSDTHADVQRSLTLLSQALGVGDAPALWRAIQTGLDTAAASVPAAWRGQRVYFEVDESPYAAGAASYLGETLARLSLGNIAGPQWGPFPKLNPEYVLKSQPGVVMLRASALAAMQERSALRPLRALHQGRVCAFDEAQNDLLVRPGPRLGQAAQVLADCLRRLPPPLSPP